MKDLGIDHVALPLDIFVSGLHFRRRHVQQIDQNRPPLAEERLGIGVVPLAEQRLLLHAGHDFARAVPGDDPFVLVDHKRGIGQKLDDIREPLFGRLTRRFRPLALGPCAQCLDAVRQVTAQLREKLHLLGIKSIRLLRVNRQGAEDLVIQKDRQGDAGCIAPLERFFPPRSETGLGLNVSSYHRFSRADRCPRGPPPAFRVRPGDARCLEVPFLEPGMGHGAY